MNRREFLAAAAVSAGLREVHAAADGQQPLRVIDTHVHLWDVERLRLPWIEKGTPLARSFSVRDYQNAVAGLNVIKGVYMEVDVDPRDLVAEAEFVLEICRQGNTPLVAAVIGGRPDAEDFPKYLERFRGNRYLKGVRRVLHTAETRPGHCLTPAFIRGVQILGRMNLSFDLCMRPTDLGDAVKLVAACPNVRFILDHCGNGPVHAQDRSQWQRDMERLARMRNVVCKVSGIVVQARAKWTPADLAPVVSHTLDTFGPDRVMFAGDWPVCTLRATYRQWLDALKTLVQNRPAADQRKLFHDNAVAFYGLK